MSTIGGEELRRKYKGDFSLIISDFVLTDKLDFDASRGFVGEVLGKTLYEAACRAKVQRSIEEFTNVQSEMRDQQESEKENEESTTPTTEDG